MIIMLLWANYFIFYNYTVMTKTKTQKVLAIVALGALMLANFSAVSAATQIGTGSVTGTGAFNAAIMWNDLFPGTASGKVQNIVVRARVLPSLNMAISSAEINLGDLAAGLTSSGGLFLEIGTNAKSGVSITARSQSGGLSHTTEAGVQINDLTTDGLAESYTWRSVKNATDDSASPSFSATDMATAVQVNNAVTEHAIYTTTKGEATNLVDDVEFRVAATTSSETPAGNYQDRVTFTVTGNF